MTTTLSPVPNPDIVPDRLLTKTWQAWFRQLYAFVTGGLSASEGTAATMGVGALVGGTLLVANAQVTATTRIFLSDQGGGVPGNIGSLYVSARVPGTSFTVTSTNGADTSNFAWLLVQPR